MLAAGGESPLLPAQFAGLLAGVFGMVAGSLVPTVIGREVQMAEFHHFHPHPLHAHHAPPHEHHEPMARHGEAGTDAV